MPISHLVAEPSGWKLRRYSVDLDQFFFTDGESGILWEDTLFELQLSGVWSCRAVPMRGHKCTHNSLICKARSNSNESGWCESSVEYGHDSLRPCEGSRETGLE